ncbi:MAG: hypothetical protein K9W42_10465 [Candidatus Heimdallarchaeota archaeon]|nr:hypothetical protein [Candidatus Heimdallarchaeota archaeon]
MAELDLPTIPNLQSLIMMAITAFSVSIIVILLFIKYFQRKRLPALTLAFTFLMWDFASLIVFIFGLIHYLNYSTPQVGVIQYARYGINLGYAFSALSNALMVLFVSQIYSQAPIFRKTKKIIPIVNGLLNGVTIGFVVDSIMQSFEFTDVVSYLNPAYSLNQIIYHLVLTFFSFTLLLSLSARQRRKATFRWEKAGFSFIVYSAIAGILVYVFLALDELAQTLIPLFNEGYTIFNVIGWAFGILLCILAYFGYVMPKWLRDRYKEKTSEVK